MKNRSDKKDWPNKWTEILDKIMELPCNKSIMSVLRRVILAASVYYIWNERNKRLFGNEKRSYQDLMATIVNNVRWKLASLTVKKSTKVEEVSKAWQVIMNINKDSEQLLDVWNGNTT